MPLPVFSLRPPPPSAPPSLLLPLPVLGEAVGVALLALLHDLRGRPARPHRPARAQVEVGPWAMLAPRGHHHLTKLLAVDAAVAVAVRLHAVGLFAKAGVPHNGEVKGRGDGFQERAPHAAVSRRVDCKIFKSQLPSIPHGLAPQPATRTALRLS